MAPVLDKYLSKSYLKLSQPDDKVQCMYVWIDGSLRNLRCKTRTARSIPKSASDLPRWEFCGSATELDVGDIADVYAQPIALYNDPFRTENNKLVLCETYTRDRIPSFANNRQRLLSAVDKTDLKNVKIEIHQPFSLHWPNGKLVCLTDSTDIQGSGLFCGKAIPEAHYRACLYAGVDIKSMEAIQNTGKWKYSVGSDDSVKAGDDLWISRFILNRIGEDFGVVIRFDVTGESSSISLSEGNCKEEENQRIIEVLTSKFSTTEEVKISRKSGSILLSGINPECDPYLTMTKVFEAFPVSL